MIRATLVTILYAIGGFLGLQSVLIAGSMLIWNDIYRPAAFARYSLWLHPETFPSHHYCAVILVFAMLFTKWKKRWNAATTILVVVLGWTWISAIYAENTTVAFEQATQATKYLWASIVMSIALTSRRWQQVFLYMLAYSVGIWAAWHGVLTIMRGAPEIHMAIPNGQMTDRNDFLCGVTAAMPLLIYTAWHYVGMYQKWVRLGTKALCALSLVIFFTSLSRGAILGLSALIMFYVLGTGRFGRRAAISLVFVCIVLPIVPDFVWGRMGTIEFGEEQTEGSAAQRVSAMLTAVDMTLDHPILGVGPDNYYVMAPSYNENAGEPHCIWLKCSSEFGLTLAVFFFAAMAFIVLRLRSIAIAARKIGNKDTEAIAIAIACALFGFLATGSFLSQFLSEYMWAIVALGGAFIARERVRGEEALMTNPTASDPEPTLAESAAA